MTRRKTYLVTGGLGFLGSALARRLAEDGRRVRVFDDASRGAQRRLAGARGALEVVRGDVRDAAAVRKAARGVDVVCHLAFVNGTRFFYEKPELVLDVGVKGMCSVLDACRAEDVRELIVASSSEVYQTPSLVPTPEDVPLAIPDALNPRYSYAAGKIISEIMTLNYGRTGFARAVLFRPHNVFGPDMGWEHVIPEFALRMRRLRGRKGPADFEIQGTGRETRAFIYIDDFVDGLMRVVDRGRHLNVYHIGTQDERSIASVAKDVARCLGLDIRIRPGPAARGGTPRRCPDISKLRRLGFAPKTPFAEALTETVKWYDQNAHLRPI